MKTIYQCFNASRWQTRYKEGINTHVISDPVINKRYIKYTNKDNIRPLVYNKRLIMLAKRKLYLPIVSKYFHQTMYK